jgi:RNA polymerase sigma factor (sigma-70 family)
MRHFGIFPPRRSVEHHYLAGMTWEDLNARLPRLRDHEPACWDELSALVYPFLALCVAQTLGNGWAEVSHRDLTQDAWVRVRDGIATFRGANTPADTAACFRAWLRVVAKNVVNGHMRRRQGPTTGPAHSGGTQPNDIPTADPTPSSQAARAEWRSRLEAAIAGMGPDEQLIIRRSFYEGVSCRQIASELGMADHTAVSQWRTQILATLRRVLGESE